MDWIKSPIKENKNIAVLKGAAGSGKTVILRQLYYELKKDELPIIALKADISKGESVDNLEKKLGLSTSLVDSIDILTNEFEKVIVIIDQIDALSQALSANREYIQTYTLLIHKLKTNPGVRIVVSCREYDLSYDADLIPLQKHKIIDAALLDVSEVGSILKTTKVNISDSRLLNLLQTPLHLELFCQVYQDAELSQIHSLYDLYSLFWKEKLVKKKSKELINSCRNTLYKIVDRMYSEQSLVVSSVPFDDEALTVLESEGIVQQKGTKQIQVFHQTFYDFVFAKQFVETKKNIFEYLNENNQGLFIRSCLKIILAYLRDYDLTSYVKLVDQLIKLDSIRFHIKELVILSFGYVESPHEKEKNFVKEKIIGTEYQLLFIESINKVEWINFLIVEGLLNKFLFSRSEQYRNAVINLINRNANTASPEVGKYLMKLSKSRLSNNLVSNFLYFLQHWDDNAILLFGRIRKDVAKSDFHYGHMMEQAMATRKDWVFEEYAKMLLSKASNLGERIF